MIDRAPLFTALSMFVTACGSGPSTPPATPAAAAPSAEAPPAESTAPVHHAASALHPALATQRAPDVFQARFATSNGVFVIEVHRDWAPNGADRFYNLVKLGVY